MYLNEKEKWAAILQKVQQGIKNIFPIEAKTGRIDLIRLELPDKNIGSIENQKNRLMSGASLATPIYGEFKLTRGGKTETARIKILDLPILTERGTFIVQGKDYSVFNQVRLKPGVYVRHTAESDAVFADFNLGKGLGFDIEMDNDGAFFVRFDKSMVSSSSKKIPLYSLLKALDTPEDQIKAAWGEDAYKVNVAKAPKVDEDIQRIVETTVYATKRTGDNKKDLKDYFSTTRINEDTTKITLGTATPSVTPKALLDASAKIVRVYTGKEEDDDLDSLLFKEVLGVEDHLQLRIEKKSKEEGLLYKVQAKIDGGAPLKSIILPNFLTKLVEGFFTKSSLSAPQTEINPIEILETNHKITAMGEGGISSERAIPMSARNLHPSHFGFLDPVRTTESNRVGIDLRSTMNTVVKDRNIYTTFLDKNGKEVQLKPADLVGKNVGFPNQEGKEVVRVLSGSKMKEVPRSQVDYWVPKSSNMFTITTNLVPFLHNDQGNRITMAGRMVTQAVPLVHREAPLVQIRDQSGKYKTIQEHYGKEFFVPRAPHDGTVTEVTSKYIMIDKTKVEIYDNFPLNLKCPSGDMRINILRVDGFIWRGKIKDYKFQYGDKIQSIELGKRVSNWKPVNAFDWQDNDKVLYNIKFKSSRCVTVTEDHSLITVDSEGKLVPIFPKDCIPGRTKCPVVTMIKPQQPACEFDYDTYDHGVLAGLYVAEGCITDSTIRIAVSPKDNKVQVQTLFEKIRRTTASPCVCHTEVRFTDEDLAQWLKLNFGRFSESKFISNAIFNYSTEFIEGFIRGYLAGDGTTRLTPTSFAISATTISKQLAHDFMDLLALGGIFSTFRTNKLPNGNTAYIVSILQSSIPVDYDMFYYVGKNEDFKTKFATAQSRNTYGRPHGNYSLTAEAMKDMPADVVNKWNTSDVVWDTIKSIEVAPHEPLVYDIEVGGSNMFAVENGLLIHNTFLTMYPLVKVGDKVKQGDILADSNFTKDGELALGTNLNVAYIPYKGWTHEDSVVISESTAKKLTSQHMYTKEFETSADAYIDKASYIKWFPTKITPENIKKLDESGVIQKGVTVNRGDILITGLRRKTMTSGDNMMRRLRGSLVNPYKDAAEVWDHDTSGQVIEVIKQGKLTRVIVTTEDEAKRGDKITGLHGNKGTIGLILPDNEMPMDENGNHVDAMMNPTSVPSRVNPGQMYEALEGKRARALGAKKVIIDNFDPADSSQKVLAKMKRDGVKVEETLYDPKTGKSLGKVFVGTPYIVKLHKQTEGNFSALYRGAYDVNMQPVKGGEEGSKGVGLLDVYALLGHNARNNLAEMATYKSDRNDDFWNRLEAGLTPMPAKEPFAFNKFKSLVTASGINVETDPQNLTLAPLNDKSILAMSKGAIQKGSILENHMGKDRPEKGGIFDPAITGGLEGGNWAHIDLASPVVNPLFEGVVSTLLQKDISTMTGTQVKKELAAINVDKRIGEIKAALQVAKGSSRNKLLKELKYLAALKKSGMKPQDYVLTKFPIIPPQFRPIYDSQTGGLPMVSDVNYLYKDMLNVNEKLEKMKDYPDEEKAALLKDLRQSAQAIVGLMAPINKQNEKRGVTGFLPQLTGSNYSGVGTSKESFFHRKILKRQQALTGRGTILPDPDLHIDNVKIPWDMAWKVYQPFIIAEFRKRGLSVVKAREEIKNRSDTAKQILVREMEKRPVLINRAPTLHKYNIMAVKPIGTEGKSIYIPPLIIKGFAADFDGDSVSGDTTVCVQDKQGRIKAKKIRDVEVDN